MNYLRHHLFHYAFLLALILCAGIAAIWLQNSTYRWWIIGPIALTYLVWGIWHHWEHHDLTKEVVLEYLAIALLLVVVMTLISG
jgi:hypothetical protein